MRAERKSIPFGRRDQKMLRAGSATEERAEARTIAGRHVITYKPISKGTTIFVACLTSFVILSAGIHVVLFHAVSKLWHAVPVALVVVACAVSYRVGRRDIRIEMTDTTLWSECPSYGGAHKISPTTIVKMEDVGGPDGQANVLFILDADLVAGVAPSRKIVCAGEVQNLLQVKAKIEKHIASLRSSRTSE